MVSGQWSMVNAQITIGGNVFGGAKQANVAGASEVTIHGGDTADKLIAIKGVYGGNDISGHVTQGATVETDGQHLFIGQLFGGGNGDYEGIYDYNSEYLSDNVTPNPYYHAQPVMTTAAINICGGTYGYVYAGGNAATVTGSIDITINNDTEPLKIDNNTPNTTSDDLFTDEQLQAMGINTAYFDKEGHFNFARVFGGNNKADMNIRPTWHLQQGKIENLYSGGNEGRMLSPDGLLLEIQPDAENDDKLIVENVYGGCRKADVRPMANGKDILVRNIEGYNFPHELSARLLVRGGDIKNVYGGNDVTGRVYGGNAVGVYTSIRGDIYGGGNGSYPYTDNADIKNNPTANLLWGDFYYNPDDVISKELATDPGYTYITDNSYKSVEALKLFRPNAEQVSIRVVGKTKTSTVNGQEVTDTIPTVIKGSIYIGGNSATLKNTAQKYLVELKVGSFVIAENVFLGNNGEHMVEKGMLTQYNYGIDADGEVTTNTAATGYKKYSQMDLVSDTKVSGRTQFDVYMDGCAMDLMPAVVFDGDGENDNFTYDDYTTYFRSFYCGGNRGSMTKDGKLTINFRHEILICDKVVGGSNNANVHPMYLDETNQTGQLNTHYEGGVKGAPETGTDDKVELNFRGLKIQPKRWWTNAAKDGPKPANYPKELVWNTIKASTGQDDIPVTTLTKDTGKDYESSDDDDMDRRLTGGHIYGGCYNSGHVNGNVIINIDKSVIDRKGRFAIFDQVEENEGEAILYGNDNYQITGRRSGVILDEQGMDVLGTALNVFGGGYGEDSEIWGSTTINLNGGYVFQVFGGGEKGPVGKSEDPASSGTITQCTFNGKTYKYNPKYSCTINVKGKDKGVYRGHEDDKDDMAEAEFIYGGAFFAPVAGNTCINLGNGRVFNTFAGSCNADILGHTETYVGRQLQQKTDGTYDYVDGGGFPWIRDHIYGGNDLGGRIKGMKNFYDRVNTATKPSVYRPDPSVNTPPEVTNASAYIEYIQGRLDYIFGGCYGVYDYTDPHYKDYTYTCTKNATTGAVTYTNDGSNENNVGLAKASEGFIKPRMENAFVNFKPISHADNAVNRIYGAGEGYSRDSDRDVMQNRSYILIDIPQSLETKFQNLVVFGSGDFTGLGMSTDEYTVAKGFTTALGYEADKDNGISLETARTNTDGVTAAAVIDLYSGHINNVYGGSYNEGNTRRTIVNVPAASTIQVNNIFGGAYGVDTYLPCDVYEGNVNYNSNNALVAGAIYGGNNNERRTLYGKVNISSTVWSDKTKGYMAKVFGAGHGGNTWSEYTEVNLNDGAQVYEVYGGGEAGKVHNAESIQKFINEYKPSKWADGSDFTDQDWKNAWKLGYGYDYDPNATAPAPNTYWENTATNLANSLVTPRDGDDRDFSFLTEDDKKLVVGRFSTNVIINEGATVHNYGYGGGLGAEAVVAGSTYIALLGGEVKKDIYAAGTRGSVEDLHSAGIYDSGASSTGNRAGFMASANVYIQGGTVRNVYGGGWRGNVGHHTGTKNDPAHGTVYDPNSTTGDIDGESHVVIGNLTGTTHKNGIPSITRNVYGGGEGGAIYGKAYVKVYNGYIGYRYKNTAGEGETPNYQYVPELNDKTTGDLDRGGNVFGGGYVPNSYVDYTDVDMYGGIVRGSLYGGGEVGPVGRGTVHKDSLNVDRIKNNYLKNGAAIYKGGETHIDLYDGHVMRDVFGGGRGYDNWGGEGYFENEDEKLAMDRSSKGYVFGKTEVHIHGGEVGTAENAMKGYGNVFGGGNEGFVYSATGSKHGTQASDTDYDQGFPRNGGGFYYSEWDASDKSKWKMSEDCRVDITPFCMVLDSNNDGDATTTSITIDGTTYKEGEYVKVEALNKLGNWNAAASDWAKLDTKGIVIHNAVFAGGNITEGSDIVSASTVTVYGNAGASLRDVFNYDLVTLGSDDIGGLYGDGNLTLVDGFREIHIDNYGTDYYSLDETMDLARYNNLKDRQKTYYQLKYAAKDTHPYTYYESRSPHEYTYTDNGTEVTVYYRKGQKVPPATWNGFSQAEQANWASGSKSFQKDEQIDDGEYGLMDPAEQENHWTLLGVCNKYAGRPLNTIQRADMCGVFGSRMVLKGAQDRVPNTVDYTDYTINRVDELSLNKQTSSGEEHGNYFGIYSSVNYLGNLTSDVFFDDVRQTDPNVSDEAQADGTTSYYAWKAAKPTSKFRNNGQSHNKVALASGVYLEIKREEGERTGTDEWGYITGIIELDLINVMKGMGGGYVYARNEHGTKSYHSGWGKVTLLDYNNSARTYRHFEYDNGTNQKQLIETSGNFVHHQEQIVDDCYPNSGMYNPEKAAYEDSPAHYWFIKGSIYVYEQYISAYTGAANAYAEKVELPLTISAASNGRMTLREVQPNYYAYYEKNGNKIGDPNALNADTVFVANDIAYKLNDPISYWQYRLLSEGDKAKFVEETYVTIDKCTLTKDNGDGTTTTTVYPKGYVMLPDEYDRIETAAPTGKLNQNDSESVKYVLDENNKRVAFSYMFRKSNNLSHNTGYILTYDVDNPGVWDNYYTKTALPGQANAIDTEHYTDKNGTYHTTQSDYTESPTFTLKTGQTNAVYGQETIKQGALVYGTDVVDYTTNVKPHLTPTAGQAEVARAWVVLQEISVKDAQGHEIQQLYPGTTIVESNYTPAQWATFSGKIEQATVCTSLMQIDTKDYVYAGKILPTDTINALKGRIMATFNYTSAEADAYLAKYTGDAYICTKTGLYGGYYFEEGKAYRALETFCNLPKADRDKFKFNYDALDLLIDPTYDSRLESQYGYKPQYDGIDPTNKEGSVAQHDGHTPLSPKIYSVEQPIDYEAEFVGYDGCSQDANSKKYIEFTKKNDTSPTRITEGDPWLTRTVYEEIPNEKHHYSPISVTTPGEYYVVNAPFMRGDIPYTTGQVIDADIYPSLTDQQKENIIIFEFLEKHNPQKEDPSGNKLYKDGNGNQTTDATDATTGHANTPIYDEKKYYYCRNSYTIDEKGMGVAVTTVEDIESTTKAIVGSTLTSTTTTTSAKNYDVTDSDPNNDVVPKAVIIDNNQYNRLPNYQKGFVVHGKSPTETSTLYVSSESDINDLSKEKIITVIYLYEYEESDESGMNVTPISERHIVNIHINFKSGVPQIGKLNKPDIVLPGTTIGLEIPTVTEGAYRVTNSGWEIFSNQENADTHTNGMEYINNVTPVYWYQNDYWIAYYAESYLGKTYSNSVRFNVANYHDLKKVMDDKQHHYYIDHRDTDYDPKIYINDYSSSNENGLDMLKDLMDLTHGKTLTGHEPLDISLVHHKGENSEKIENGEYLEFFLHTDIDYSVPSSSPAREWTPIASGTGECFSGDFHGDGHTIGNLTGSLFDKLCGNVYNTGVTGPFTSAGIANQGDGFVENCWVKSTANSLPDGVSPAYAVFGNPTGSGTQVVNSYFATDNAALYTTATDDNTKIMTSGGERGKARGMTEREFYNGTVAYNLNGFYLYKRYCDAKAANAANTSAAATALGGSAADYKYWKPAVLTPQTGYYGSNITYCSSGVGTVYATNGYVEDRFADGDFRFADGVIPENEDERAFVDTNDGNKVKYYPVWPDDYLYFGQMLTYGYSNEQPHEDLPSAVAKSGGRLLTTTQGNRVYRAPAYYRSKNVGVAHFNPWANLAAHSKPKTITDTNWTLAYPDMTAIDFKGHDTAGNTPGLGTVTTGFATGKPAFYPPLLDDDGLQSVENNYETLNLLVYAPAESANKATYDVLTGYFKDPAFADYDESDMSSEDSKYKDDKTYNRVAEAPTSSIHGHLVMSGLTATTDHLLVDKQDFNCPIAYSFDNSHRMWYQRKPSNYVSIEWSSGATPKRSTKGWEGVSLPFVADLVTTHQKGELTHFYSAADGSATDAGRKGHEYWLRQFTGIDGSKSTATETVAKLVYPKAETGGDDKVYGNHFLWDYYYSKNSRKDFNNDEYQEGDDFTDDTHTYYKQDRTYDDYPRIQGGMPYLIGFPGEQYYEFDLSGSFTPKNTASPAPDKLEVQAITFASATGASVEVSDTEISDMLTANTLTHDGYTFMPTYMSKTLKAVRVDNSGAQVSGDATKKSYALNSDGSAYTVVTRPDGSAEGTNDLTVQPFRPYFVEGTGSLARKTRSIVFSNEYSQLQPEEQQEADETVNGTLDAYARRHKIVVTSTLRGKADVRIINAGGITVASFTMEPGDTVETRIINAGVYIVQSDDGLFIKKLAVK